ncbi:hypothetical protein B0H13DRAFT_1861083 [Mycena leptocephala]|nr:hypothetical protein B0H13DRAFT_1861083 [Mycena leptocephala]
MSTPYPQDRDAPPYLSSPTPQGTHTILQPGYQPQPAPQGYPPQGYPPQEYPPQQQYAPQQQQYAPQPNPIAVAEQYRANWIHQPSKKFGVFGIVMAVIFFPFGLIFLFIGRERWRAMADDGSGPITMLAMGGCGPRGRGGIGKLIELARTALYGLDLGTGDRVLAVADALPEAGPTNTSATDFSARLDPGGRRLFVLPSLEFVASDHQRMLVETGEKKAGELSLRNAINSNFRQTRGAISTGFLPNFILPNCYDQHQSATLSAIRRRQFKLRASGRDPGLIQFEPRLSLIITIKPLAPFERRLNDDDWYRIANRVSFSEKEKDKRMRKQSRYGATVWWHSGLDRLMAHGKWHCRRRINQP